MGEGDEEPDFIQLEFEELPADEMLSRCLLYTSDAADE